MIWIFFFFGNVMKETNNAEQTKENNQKNNNGKAEDGRDIQGGWLCQMMAVWEMNIMMIIILATFLLLYL